MGEGRCPRDAFLTLDDRHRFRRSRDAGCFVGLKPGRRDFAESQPQMHISKEGDRYLRTILVQGRTTSWDPLGKIVICGDGDCGLPGAERKTPRNELLLRWPESWRYDCIGCGRVEKHIEINPFRARFGREWSRRDVTRYVNAAQIANPERVWRKTGLQYFSSPVRKKDVCLQQMRANRRIGLAKAS